jgi:hypothetical protein
MLSQYENIITVWKFYHSMKIISQYENVTLSWREQIHSYSDILSLDCAFDIGTKTYNGIAAPCYFIPFRRKQNRDATRNLKTWSSSMPFLCDRYVTLMLQRIISHKHLICTLSSAPVFVTKILTHNVAGKSKERKLLCRLQSQYESVSVEKVSLPR